MSNTLDTFRERSCIKGKTIMMKITKTSIEKNPNAIVIIRNQNENPAETARALNLGEDSSILDRVHKSD